MSYDQILPSMFASLKTRFRVPIYTFIYVFIVGVLFSWLFSYNILGFGGYFMDSCLVFLLAMSVTGIAAVVLPYKKKEVFKASPISKYMVGKYPLMSIGGIIYVLFTIVCTYYYLVDPRYGVNGLISGEFLVVMYIVGFIIYFAFKYYRKTKGVDVTLAFREIPGD